MNKNRYIRQIQLREFGPEAQQKLQESSILVVGAGGLGIPVLTYLNAMGVGTIGLVEQDLIDETNLHRQVLYSETDIGQPKLRVAVNKLIEQNSNTEVIAHDTFLVKENALDIIKDYDLVVDASDNFATRYLVNDACVILNKPLVYGALYGFEGHVSVFNHHGGPTYRCLFPSMPAAGEIPDCNQQGVLGVLPGIIGNLQALEAVKVISGIGESLSGQLLIFNSLSSTYHKIAIPVVKKNLLLDKLEMKYEAHYCDPSYDISAYELHDLLEKQSSIQLIDVRTEEEFEGYHLPGSSNIPLSDLQDRIPEIDKNKPVYLLCQSGVRSLQALHLLLDNKFSNPIFHLKGGLDQFKILSS